MGDEHHLHDDLARNKFAPSIIGEDFKAGLSRGDKSPTDVSILWIGKGLDIEVEFHQVIASKTLAALEQISGVH
jgi:hypothetical protein